MFMMTDCKSELMLTHGLRRAWTHLFTVRLKLYFTFFLKCRTALEEQRTLTLQLSIINTCIKYEFVSFKLYFTW